MSRPKESKASWEYEVMPALNVGDEVVRAYQMLEPELIAKATAVSLSRGAVGDLSEVVADNIKDKGLKAAVVIGGLFARVFLLAADTADTRSSETLPARFSVIRVPMDPGVHDIVVSTRDKHRRVRITMAPRAGPL